MVCSTFLNFLLRDYIFQSAKCEITSFSMKSLHVDLNEAAKCVDRIASHLIAPSHNSTKYKMATIFGLT